MKLVSALLLASLHLPAARAQEGPVLPADATPSAAKPPATRLLRLVDGQAIRRRYPYALPTLLKAVNERTTLHMDEQPAIISSFEDEAIFQAPFIFVNFADRQDWTFSPLERQNLKAYLEGGGFIFVDAGISAEFLRGDTRHGQHHSFAEWDAAPQLKEAFATVFPGKPFQPLKRSHPLFRCFYKGLPDSGNLPDTVRDFVVNEKWPDGTYSAVALHLDGRIAVLAMPIISMGWGKDPFGNWASTISFRIRESAEGLSERLETAAYSGERFETVREDTRKDIIYCQKKALPAWVQEPDGHWRVFRYYQSREISDFAHVFYTRLGINILVYAATH